MLFFLAVPQVPAAFPRLEALPSSAEVPLNGNAQLPWRASLPGILAGEQPERSRKTPAPSFVQNAVPPCEKTRDFLQRSTRIRIQRPTFPLPYTTPCNILCLYHIKSIQTPIQNRNIAPYFYLYYVIFKKNTHYFSFMTSPWNRKYFILKETPASLVLTHSYYL